MLFIMAGGGSSILAMVGEELALGRLTSLRDDAAGALNGLLLTYGSIVADRTGS